MRKAKGFSLIELLIVVAIILIIAAIAIPNLIRAKISANEASAVSSTRTIYSMNVEYSLHYPQVGYADDVTKLGPPAPCAGPDPNHGGLVDFILGCAAQPCLKSGYLFSIDQVSGAIPNTTFRVTGVPATPQRTGVRGFCADVAGVLSADPNSGTNCTDPVAAN